MSTQPKPELVSFDLCPFVQRSVIALRVKAVDFDITYIDLQDKPDWFLAISPFGKVPVLRVGETVLFESAIINEYLDETIPPAMHPADPLRRAHNRAWIEFGSSLFGDQYRAWTAEEESSFADATQELKEKLEKVEGQLGRGPYFNGELLSLVDAAYAPLFTRLALVEEIAPLGVLDGAPKVRAWSQALLARDEVQNSVIPGFAEKYMGRVREGTGILARRVLA